MIMVMVDEYAESGQVLSKNNNSAASRTSPTHRNVQVDTFITISLVLFIIIMV